MLGDFNGWLGKGTDAEDIIGPYNPSNEDKQTACGSEHGKELKETLQLLSLSALNGRDEKSSGSTFIGDDLEFKGTVVDYIACDASAGVHGMIVHKDITIDRGDHRIITALVPVRRKSKRKRKQKECELKLAHNVLEIGKFYYRTRSYQSAINTLK